MSRVVVVTAIVGVLAALSFTNAASAESTDGYLHNLAAPPLCPLPWETPDPSLPVCQARVFAPRLALTSQSVVLRIGDFEASQDDCASYFTAQTTTFTIDGAAVPIVVQPCRELPHSIDNVITLPAFGADRVWETDYRYLMPAGSLLPGIHIVTWTASFTSSYSYTLGCDDPSGRCTVPAGSVFTSTTTLTIV